MPEFDFDPSESDLTVGLEVEYPIAPSFDEKDRYTKRGLSSSDLQRGGYPANNIRGNWVYDGTVGLEYVSEPISASDAASWYKEVIDYVEDEFREPFAPVGLMDGGSTAGLHIHISSISEDKARDLFELSQTPWAQVAFCSSIASDGDGLSWPVFRGGSYCRMNWGSNRYNCVNQRDNGHYEWRLPEPMDPEHLDVVMRFLQIFDYSTEKAIEYVQERLDAGDERITAIKRAEMVGMDIDDVPSVAEAQSPDDPNDFYEQVASEWAMPTAYRVTLSGDDYYIFESNIEDTVEAAGVEFHPNDVLHAETLSATDREIAGDVRRVFENRGDRRRETEATKELKKIVKKKK